MKTKTLKIMKTARVKKIKIGNYKPELHYYYIVNERDYFLCNNPLRFTANNMFALEYICEDEAQRMLSSLSCIEEY